MCDDEHREDGCRGTRGCEGRQGLGGGAWGSKELAVGLVGLAGKNGKVEDGNECTYGKREGKSVCSTRRRGSMTAYEDEGKVE